MFVMCRYVYDVWVCLWCMGMFVMCGYDYNVLLPNVTWLGKSYNITGLNRTLGLQKFEPPRISTESAHECGKVVSPTDWPSVHSRKYPWYLFPLEIESIPRPYWCQKDYVTKKWLHPNRTRDLPVCKAVPEPTAPPRNYHTLRYQCLFEIQLPTRWKKTIFERLSYIVKKHCLIKCNVSFFRHYFQTSFYDSQLSVADFELYPTSWSFRVFYYRE